MGQIFLISFVGFLMLWGFWSAVLLSHVLTWPFMHVADDQEGGDGVPVSNIPSDYIKCPHCERHFGPKAADRHISWCREQRNRVPRSPADNQAVERLKSRTKVSRSVSHAVSQAVS